jgi:uncharacterized protein DUF6230
MSAKVTGSDPPELVDSDPVDEAAQGGVRWRRFAGMLLASTIAVSGLVALTAQGVLAAQFAVSGLPFTVTATRLDGQGFEQFATLDEMAPDSPNAGDTGGQLVLVVSAIRSATLTDLCQSVSLGGISLKITAGDAGTPVSASNLVVDSDQLSGDASFANINIGQDASTLTEVPGVTGNIGVFGQQSDTVTLLNLRQNNFATTAAAFHLPNLHLRFESEGC